jgi:hypothetical protein
MLKSPQQIIDEMRQIDDGKQERTSTAGLIKEIIKDAKQFFDDLFKKHTDKLSKNKFSVEVKNFPKPPDVQKIDGSVSLKDTKALLIGLNEIIKVVENTKKNVETQTKQLEKSLKPEKTDFSSLEKAVKEIVIPAPLKEISVDNQIDYNEKLDLIKKEISKLKLDPKINVETKASDVTIDLEGVKSRLQTVVEAIKGIPVTEPTEIDLKPLIKSTKETTDAIEALRFPVPSGKVTINNPMTSTGGLPTTDVGSDDQKIIDTSGPVYIGRAARGVATSDTGWLLTKIVTISPITITHAIDSWDNAKTSAVYS